MVASHPTIDPTTTNEKGVSQPMMKIQTTNVRLVPPIDQYLEPLWMLVETLNNLV